MEIEINVVKFVLLIVFSNIVTEGIMMVVEALMNRNSSSGE
ncbi:putative branched-chain amino acid ABC transpoter permease [Vibrio virus VPMCC5]|nr:putative branched-chain amino acid ABC transpoter permease [Vibrio virus VPMCC5]